MRSWIYIDPHTPLFLQKSSESPETKGLVILDSAKECVRISKHAGYKGFCFSQLQKRAQRIETEIFRWSKGALKKEKAANLAASFHTHVYLSDILNESDELVKEKLRHVMSGQPPNCQTLIPAILTQRTSYTCDVHGLA